MNRCKQQENGYWRTSSQSSEIERVFLKSENQNCDSNQHSFDICHISAINSGEIPEFQCNFPDNFVTQTFLNRWVRPWKIQLGLVWDKTLPPPCYASGLSHATGMEQSLCSLSLSKYRETAWNRLRLLGHNVIDMGTPCIENSTSDLSVGTFPENAAFAGFSILSQILINPFASWTTFVFSFEYWTKFTVNAARPKFIAHLFFPDHSRW